MLNYHYLELTLSKSLPEFETDPVLSLSGSVAVVVVLIVAIFGHGRRRHPWA
jgi:hypothetical protein